MNKNGFSLMELLVVCIIVGILSTIAITQYGGYKEKTLDREAQANLRLIIAAERVSRMENNAYYASTGAGVTAITNINTNLRLMLPFAGNRAWDYVTTARVLPTADACAQATRFNGPDMRTWRFRISTDNDPVWGGTCP